MMRVVIAIILASGALFAAAGPVTITLRAEVVVAADFATIGDVAEIEAASPELQATIAALPVQELPDLTGRTVEAATIRALVRRSAPNQPVNVSGTCRLSRAAAVVTADELNSAAVAMVRAKNPTADISIIRAANPVTVMGGTAPDLVAEALGGDGVGEAPFRVRVLRHGRELGRTLVVLHVAVIAQQVVAARPIAKGALIDIADLRVERLPLRSGIKSIANPEFIAGSLARVDIAEGATIAAPSIKTRPAVDGGQPVTLIYVHGDFALSAPATAMGDAAIGEQVNVRRSTDGKLVLATVVNQGVVEIGP